MGALCSVSFFLHLSVLQLGRDWWPLRREVTPRLMCSHCKEKENAKQGPRTSLWSWSLDAVSRILWEAVWLSSVLAAVLILSWVLHQVFPTRSRKRSRAAARLWNKGVESRGLCRSASRAVSPQSTIKSPKSPQSRTLVQEGDLLQPNDCS